MEGICRRCQSQLEAQWKFCPQCGLGVIHEAAEHPAEAPVRPQSAPVLGAFSGLLFGLLAAPVMLIVGTMLCLTGLGAIAGIPMIIGGILAPLLGPMLGIGALRGKCPWCGARVSSVLRTQGFYCHVCSGRIAVVNRRFEKATPAAAA